MDAHWITVRFTPATTPYFVHMLSSPDDTTTWIQEGRRMAPAARVQRHRSSSTHRQSCHREDYRSGTCRGAASGGDRQDAWCLPRGWGPDPDHVERTRRRWADQADPDAEGPHPV